MQSKSCKVRFTAHVTLNGKAGVELVVRRAVVGGIQGPFITTRLDLGQVEGYLADSGFSTTAWRIVNTYDGAQLEAELVRS